MMKITTLKPLLVVLWLFMPFMALSQGPQYSDYILKYNLSTYQLEDNKKIPFDHPFTLMVDSLSGKNIKKIFLFRSKIVDGVREKTTNRIRNDQGVYTDVVIFDKELSYKVGAEKLIIYFDPLKPNTLFDVHVVYKVVPTSRIMLMETNRLLELGDEAKAKKNFDNFRKTMYLGNTYTTYTTLDAQQYKNFYQAKLQPVYARIKANVDTKTTSLNAEDLIAMGMASTKELPIYKDTRLLLSIISDKRYDATINGYIDIVKYPNADTADKINLVARINNLKSNKSYFDALLAPLENILLAGSDTVKVKGAPVALNQVRAKLRDHINAIKLNLKFLQDCEQEINNFIDDNENLNSAVLLSGSTVASDLKTAGGNVLFLDAGLTNILMRGTDNKLTYIPRMYWGVSIYFRPIDKNTRRSSFYRRSKLDSLNKQKGPDYDAIATRSIWQHLSLNLGFTLGSIPNASFDNLYNNTSLLIGPAFRFYRAFKFSAGTAIMKRDSFNPLISKKKVVAGGYASLSVDIDFIQGLKDVTSILFK